MKSSILFLAAIAAGVVSFGTDVSAAAPTGGADVAKSEKADSIPSPNPSLPLRKGMIAQDVKERWGEPASVEPFPSASGKAEVWTYYYKISDQVTQVVTSTRMQATYRGAYLGMTETPQLVYGEKHSQLNQVVRLLLYDGMLVSWKKTVERKEWLE